MRVNSLWKLPSVIEEETGLTAKWWRELGAIYDPNHATVFLAEKFSETGNDTMAEEDTAAVIRVNWSDIDRMIANGDFTDAKTLACLLLFERQLHNSE